jgi:hypothetical protein
VAGYGLTYNNISHKIQVAGLTADDITNGVNNKFFSTELAQDAAASLFTTGSHTNISFAYDDTLGKLNATVVLDGIGLTDVVNDTSPSLGGNLDLNNYNISGTGNITITGKFNSSGQIRVTPISATLISITSGVLTISSTDNMLVDMPIVFGLTSQTASTIGNIIPYVTYYIHSISQSNQITISKTIAGSIFAAGTGAGTMTITANGLDTSIITAKDVNVNSMLTFNDMVIQDQTYQIAGLGGYFVFGRASSPSNFVFNTDSATEPFTIRGLTNGFLGNQPQMTLGASRGTLANQQIVRNGDSLGLIRFNPYTGTAGMAGYSNGGFITAYVSDTSIAEGDLLVDTTIAIGNIADVDAGVYTTFAPGGYVSAPVLKVGSYNGSVNYPAGGSNTMQTTVSAGMIIFDSSNNHFYGYNGSIWKQLDN